MSTPLEKRYATLMTALPSLKPGTVNSSIAELWHVHKSTASHIVRSLRAAGYDLTAYDALVRLSVSIGKTGRMGDPDPTYTKRYALIMATLPSVQPGKLVETMRVALDYADGTSVTKLVRDMRRAGLDMSAWDAAAKRSHTESLAVREALAKGQAARHDWVKPKATEAKGLSVSQASRIASRAIVEREPIAPRMMVRDHLDQWLSDMRSVASDAAPLDRLMSIWGVTRRSVYDRIGSIRETGVDMSWWTPAPSRGFKRQVCRPQPVTIPRLMAPVESPAYRPAVPWTLQGLALVTDMPLAKVIERAERMGIEAYASTMVDGRTARLIMWTLGFTPSAAPQAA